MRKQLLAFLSRDLSNGFLWLRGRRRAKLPFRLRSFQRSLAKALVVAGLLVMWIAPSATAAIYWANLGPNSIASANLDGTGVNQSFIPIGTGNNPYGVAVDGTYIYWTYTATNLGYSLDIGRANLDGTGVNQSFIPIGTGGTSGVAVDGTYIYWTLSSAIGRANLDGTGVNQSFISTGISSGPYDVTVDGTHIYWVNQDGTIGRANLDGTGVTETFITGATYGVGIAVDGTHIYWTNDIANTIGRANLDGTGVNQSFISGANYPFGVAVDGTYIYWTNLHSGTIGRANLDGTGVNQSFISGANFPYQIAVSPTPITTITINWVPVGNPGNASNCTAANCGSVAYNYRISKYDVTNAQYAEFLNARAASDPNSLYDPNMGSDPNNGGITQSGSSGSYTYAAILGFENRPVIYVSFWSALRYANWLNNGQGNGDTETGAYTITPDGVAANSITRNPGASVFLPSENEWYKAAYYNPATSSYFAYPAGSDTPTVCAAPGDTPNTANCGAAAGNQVTGVGAYTGSASPYGTFDQGGNVYQWNEQIMGSYRGIRGGFWGIGAQGLAASYPLQAFDTAARSTIVGFRVATLAADPPSGCGMGGEMALALPLLMWLRSRRRTKSELKINR
ncbi:MAG TPA: SUMF1/EgtB/PvdO family nonheme iron enzyme [Myxococcota bacterium]|nr:SUMF1/EgtB/PvdO family nonheme iron enzyme [Myxococcota bacterium]